ncbi:hypothetical protein CRE_08478 [Caenorhabditis remanei]|uniref:SET domain-containing protein n=1 Tax=Caenorhabditis remanei TaxID=31234 RepID=E3N6T5_CAERE|nr:hypothetical protein CRE_08478 [Caenorhabditis remanei]
MRRRKPWTVKKRRPRPRKTASDSAAPPKRIRKPPAPNDQKTPLITEFFKVRRSGRKTKKQLKRETELEIHQKTLSSSIKASISYALPTILRPNLKARAISIDGAVHLILVAKSKIEVGEELLYDYGDRSSEVTSVNTWLLTS